MVNASPIGLTAEQEVKLNALSVATRIRAIFPDKIEIPDVGSRVERCEATVYDAEGNMEDPDSAPTIKIENLAGTVRVAETNMTKLSTGRYKYDHTIQSTDPLESRIITIKVIEGAMTRYYGLVFELVEETASIVSIEAKVDTVDSVVDDIETKVDTVDGVVDSVKTQTDKIPDSPATEGTSTAIKGKTDLIPADPATETSVSGVEAKVDTIDGVVDSIKTETDKIPRITNFMDFWSDPSASVTLTAGGESGVVALPDVVVADLPTGVTIIRVVAVIKIALIRDSSGSDNAIDVATGHIEVQKGGAGGYMTAINIPDNAWLVDVSSSAERGGDALIGSIDIKTKVNGNGTYNFEFDDIGVDGNSLLLVDVIVGLRVYFTV